MDIHQSEKYGQFMKLLGWRVEKINRIQVFIKKLPFLGTLIKIQRISSTTPLGVIETIVKKHKTSRVVIEFNREGSPTLDNSGFKNLFKSNNKSNFKTCGSPFLPTKTISIDLKKTEEEIFNSFSPEKRRAIRKAKKNKVIVREEKDPGLFIKIKQRTLFEKLILPLGSKKEINSLWQIFAPNQAKIIIAFYNDKPEGGVFLLFHQKKAYYWLAAATNKGKKVFAPSLLVWEALKLSKKTGSEEFDFEGIYDERFPVPSWKGFSKFKGGFGGEEILFPEPLTPCFAK